MINVIIFIVSKCGCGGTGRRAGLRNQCQRRGGSSPFIRTNDVSVRTFIEQRDWIYVKFLDTFFYEFIYFFQASLEQLI